MTLWLRYDLRTHRLDACDFLADAVARQAVGGNAVAHHPAGLLAAVADLDLVPKPTQMVGAGESRRAGADHQHALAGGRSWRNRPAFSSARSPRKRSSEWMATGASRNCRLQAPSQGW